MTVISVLLAEHEVVVRQGIRRILELDPEIEVVAEAADVAELARKAVEFSADVAIIAAGLPGGGGVVAALRLNHLAAQTRVLVLAWECEEAETRRSLVQGHCLVLAKNCSDVELVSAVKELASRPTLLRGRPGGGEAQQVHGRTEEQEKVYNLDLLTAREREVLILISQGKTNKEIGSLLGISANTADSHRKHIMEKLGIHSKTELVRFALVKGLVR